MRLSPLLNILMKMLKLSHCASQHLTECLTEIKFSLKMDLKS
uniref:Uncharacterized protein n=1 Tax=Anguilla anguilla TaxID=7936 RepID=A0A0E9S7I8_ANGAN